MNRPCDPLTVAKWAAFGWREMLLVFLAAASTAIAPDMAAAASPEETIAPAQSSGTDSPNTKPTGIPGLPQEGGTPSANPGMKVVARGVAQQAISEWPTFRGNPQATGVASSQLTLPLELLWKFDAKQSSFEGTAAIASGRVYLGDLDGALHALDLADGKPIWKFTTEIGFSASPAFHGDRVFIGDLDGIFYCVDASSGKELWRFQAEAEIDSCANFYKNLVLFGSQDACLYGLDIATGNLAWKVTIDDQIRCSPTIVDGRALVAGCDGKLHIIDLEAGKPVGSVPINGPTGVTPAAWGDVAYFGTEGGTFHAIDWRAEEALWEYESERGGGAFRGSAAVTDKLVIVGGRGKRVLGLDRETGEVVWEFVTRRNVDSSPIVVSDTVYFGSDEGRLYALDKEGQKVWEYETGGALTASPAAADGKLVIANDKGTVFCFGK